LYVRQERLEDGGNTAVAQRVITRRVSERIARKAFEMARARATKRGGEGEKGRLAASPPLLLSPSPPLPLVTVVHKANVLSLSDGLFREACLAVAREFPDVQVEEQIVDSMI